MYRADAILCYGSKVRVIDTNNMVIMPCHMDDHTSKYTDRTAIPNVTINGDWAALTTGAYCSYNNTAIVEYLSNNTGWIMKNVSKGMMNFF